MTNLYIGTCSWKYPSWEGLVYSSREPSNYLEEYSKKYNSVEVDQWFWSLGKSSSSLPRPETVAEYDVATPEEFRFTIKCPNAITMPYHRGEKGEALKANSKFLDADFFLMFIDSLSPIIPKIGLFIFQFEYLNRDKISSKNAFFDKLGNFLENLPRDLPYAIELRNPKWVDESFFDLLSKTNAAPVLLQGYWMEDVVETVEKYKSQIGNTICFRLHGEDREGMEEKTGEDWSKIIRNKDEEIEKIEGTIKYLYENGKRIFININNHYEGSAPLTIEKLTLLLSAY
jgi:uncharacterized protein YecE (DUF72 family)